MLDVLVHTFNQLPAGFADVVGIWVAALLTLAVLSYIFGNNPVFRLAQYLFVGVAAGYAGALAWNQVLWPRLLLLRADPETYWPLGIFFLLGILLLARGARPITALADLPLGVLFGVGAALALGGALTGTLVPQVQATIMPVNPSFYGGGLVGWALAIDAALLIIGTVAVFSAFQYTARSQGFLSGFWNALRRGAGSIGRGLIAVTFGALLAGAFLSFFAILSSRIAFLVSDWLPLLGQLGL